MSKMGLKNNGIFIKDLTLQDHNIGGYCSLAFQHKRPSEIGVNALVGHSFIRGTKSQRHLSSSWEEFVIKVAFTLL